jgi:hypothetical protein
LDFFYLKNWIFKFTLKNKNRKRIFVIFQIFLKCKFKKLKTLLYSWYFQQYIDVLILLLTVRCYILFFCNNYSLFSLFYCFLYNVLPIFQFFSQKVDHGRAIYNTTRPVDLQVAVLTTLGFFPKYYNLNSLFKNVKNY